MEMSALLPETRRMLDSLVAEQAVPRSVQPDPHSDSCILPSDSARAVLSLAQEYLNSAGLPMVRYAQQMSYTMSLARVLPRYRGNLLAARLVRLFGLWADKGLDPIHMQRLTVYVWQKLKQAPGQAAQTNALQRTGTAVRSQC